jgi:alpha-tubulin suppressor-like RCC1 family protein
MLISRLFKSTLILLSLQISCNFAYSQGYNVLSSWGYNGSGELGNGNNTTINQPKIVSDSTIKSIEWKQISAGASHTIAIKENGTLWSWGHNGHGELGLGNYTSNNKPQQIGKDTNWEQISAGGSFNLAIKKNGTLWSWGYNYYGQLGLGNSNTYNSPQQVGTDSTWEIVASGSNHIVALKKNGTLWSCGYSSNGQLGLGNTSTYYTLQQIGTDSNWTERISAGDGHTIAIKKDSTLWAWGTNWAGQLGLNPTISTCYSYWYGYYTCTTYASNSYSPTQVGSDSNWSKVNAGSTHTSAIKNNGTLWTWGYGAYGQIGNSSTSNQMTPTQIGVDSNWVSIENGYYSSSAINNRNQLFTWGNNGNGQLGLGNTTNFSSPQRVGQDSNWVLVSMGYYHSLGLKPTCEIPNYKGISNKDTIVGFKMVELKPLELKRWNLWSNSINAPNLKITKPSKVNILQVDSSLCIGRDSVYVKFTCISPNYTPLSLQSVIYGCSTVSLKSKNPSFKKFEWSTGDSGNSIVINKNTTVILLETDAKGCQGLDTVKVEIFPQMAKDTIVCNAPISSNLKLNVNQWFKTSDYYFYDGNKKLIENAELKLMNSSTKVWSGFVSAKDYTKFKCKVSGTVYPSIRYSRLVSKLTDTIKTIKIELKPDIIDKKYTRYLWSNGDTTFKTFIRNSGNYWFKQSDSVGCNQTDSFAFSRINLLVPTRISGTIGKKVLISVKDVSNLNSHVIWNNRDTGWSIMYAFSKYEDTITVVQQDAYQRIEKRIVVSGLSEPSKMDVFQNQDTNEENGVNSNVIIVEELNDSSFVSQEIISKIILYPNPVTTHLKIKSSSIIHGLNYEISDLNGKIIQEGQLFNNSVQVNNLKQGVYFIRFGNSVFQFLKE